MNARYRWIPALACVAAAGCTSAFALRDANEQLNSHYLAKLQAGEDWQMRESSLAALQTLAADAAAQARSESELENRIAFYRIAVTAAWQGEDSAVVGYADEGQALCAGDNFARAPRDCGMLLVIPTLAAVDETIALFNAVQQRVVAAPATVTPDDTAAAERIYTNYSDALDSLLARRASIRSSAASPAFVAAVDRNIGMLLCRHLKIDAVGLLALVDSGRLDEASAQVREAECRLLAEDFASETADCLPVACN